MNSEEKSPIQQTAEQVWEALKFCKMENTPFEWIVRDWIPKGEISMYTGQFASLKTYLQFLWTKAISTGEKFADHWEVQQNNVLILDRQSSRATLTLRRNAVGLNEQSNVVVVGLHTNPGSLDMDLGNSVLAEMCRVYRPVVFVDSLVDYIPPGASEQDPATMGQVMRKFTKLIVSGATAVVILHHKPKDDNLYRGTTAIPAATAVSAALSKKVLKDHTLLTVKQFKGRDVVEKTIKLKFVFQGDPVEKVTCTFFSEKAGDETDTDSLESRVVKARLENPIVSANKIQKLVGGNRQKVLDILAKMKTGSSETVQ